MEKNIVRSIRVTELLNDMMKADKKLYEQILDTPGFAYAFNELCKKAQEERITIQPAPPSSPTATAEELPQIIRFLLGECEFNGVWFGDMPSKWENGRFWWREYLRKYAEYASLKEQEARRQAIQEFLSIAESISYEDIDHALNKFKAVGLDELREKLK